MGRRYRDREKEKKREAKSGVRQEKIGTAVDVDLKRD